MQRKIHIRIDTEDTHFHLPKVKVKTAVGILKIALWGSNFTKDEKMKAFIHDNKHTIKQFLDLVATELNVTEPCVLVDVKSKDAIIEIELI
jgi:hypothetical protein